MEEPQSTTQLSTLIGSIYDCALDPARWESTLVAIAAALGCGKAILSLNDVRRNRVHTFKSPGWEHPWIEERARHTTEIHKVLTDWLSRQAAEDLPVVASRLVPAELMTSPYIRECLRPQEIVDVMHCFLLRTSSRFSELAVFRHVAQGIFWDEQIELGRVLTPHLRRAIIISNAFDRQSLVKSELVSALDALPCAIILTDEHGVAVHSNQNARRMLHDASVLALRQSVLHAVAVEAADRELHSALRLCVGEQNDVGRTGTAIRLTDITTPPIFAHILPLRRSDGRDWLHPRATAAVFVRTGNVRQQDIEGFAAAFALTSAETVVLSALLSGYSLTRAATSLGLARTTAKTHLEHIFQKTGVARQSELVKLAMQVFPPI